MQCDCICEFVTSMVWWKIISSYFSGDFLPDESAWPGRFSFIEFVLVPVLELITCEKWMSSATAKPRRVSCAQRENVVVTYNDFLSSAAVAKRKATALHQQHHRMSVPETQSRDLTAGCYKTNAEVLTWTLLLWQKLEVQEDKCGFVQCGVFTLPLGCPLTVNSRKHSLGAKKHRGDYCSVHCHDLSHHDLVHQPAHWDDDEEDGCAWCFSC